MIIKENVKKNFVLEGYKGSGKSHLLLLFYFILIFDDNYRVFYLNELLPYT